jgi:hypothetical protein
MREAKFLTALTQAVKWVPFMFMFFSGISLNCSKALLCHMFSINIEWSSTAKEVGPSGIYVAMDKMVKFFKFTWIIVGLLAAGKLTPLMLAGRLLILIGMIYMAFYAPWGWKIAPGLGTPAVFGIIPLAIQVGGHFLLPFTLGF